MTNYDHFKHLFNCSLQYSQQPIIAHCAIKKGTTFLGSSASPFAHFHYTLSLCLFLEMDKSCAKCLKYFNCNIFNTDFFFLNQFLLPIWTLTYHCCTIRFIYDSSVLHDFQFCCFVFCFWATQSSDYGHINKAFMIPDQDLLKQCVPRLCEQTNKRMTMVVHWPVWIHDQGEAADLSQHTPASPAQPRSLGSSLLPTQHIGQHQRQQLQLKGKKKKKKSICTLGSGSKGNQWWGWVARKKTSSFFFCVPYGHPNWY